MKKTIGKDLLIVILIITILFLFGFFLIGKRLNLNLDIHEAKKFNERVLIKGEKENTLISPSDLLSLVNRVKDINEKEKGIDIEEKYEEIELLIGVLNDKYVPGKKGSQKYIPITYNEIYVKRGEDFLEAFKDAKFIISEIKYNKIGRVDKVVIKEIIEENE